MQYHGISEHYTLHLRNYVGDFFRRYQFSLSRAIRKFSSPDVWIWSAVKGINTVDGWNPAPPGMYKTL